MKKLCVVLPAIFLSLWTMGCTSAKVQEGSPISIPARTEVIEFPGLTKKQIYDQSNTWCVREFSKAYSVIEYTNYDTGVISGKYTYDALNNFGGSDWNGVWSQWTLVKMFISIECRDGKMRLSQQPIEILRTYYHVNDFLREEWRSLTTGCKPYLNFENEAERVKTSLTQFITQNSNW